MFCGEHRVVAAIAAMGLLASAAYGETILFRNGSNVLSSDSLISVPAYSGTQDATLDMSLPDHNLGAWIDFQVGEDTGGDVRAGVVRFDVTAMTGQYQSVNSITLRLFLYSGGFVGADAISDRFVDVYTINSADQGWVEGTGGGPAGSLNPGEVCWNGPQQGIGPWGTPTLAASDVRVMSSQAGSIVSFPLGLINPTQVLNDWVLSPQNAGMRVELDSALSPALSGLLFGSRDNPTGVEFVPELLIDYVPIPAPGTFCLLAMASVVAYRKR